MKRIIGLLVASAAVVLPVTTAGALGNAEPAEYRGECESFYTSGKPLFDPLIASPLSAVLGPVEKNACGENKHVV